MRLRQVAYLALGGAVLVTALGVSRYQASEFRHQIEQRTRQAMNVAGHDWARTQIDGRTVTLSGTAPNAEALAAAEALIAEGGWAREVRNEAQVLETRIDAPPRYAIRIYKDAEGAQLTGFAPSDQDRARIGRRVEARLRGGEIANLIRSSAGEAPDAWRRAAQAGVDALPYLIHGDVTIDDEGVRVAGLAQSEIGREAAKAAVSHLLPDGMDLTLEVETPTPKISPYPFEAHKTDDGEVRAFGAMPDAETRDEFIRRAEQLLPDRIDPSFVIGPGAPNRMWADAALEGLLALDQLENGVFALSDLEARLEGVADAERSADARARFAALPEAYARSFRAAPREIQPLESAAEPVETAALIEPEPPVAATSEAVEPDAVVAAPEAVVEAASEPEIREESEAAEVVEAAEAPVEAEVFDPEIADAAETAVSVIAAALAPIPQPPAAAAVDEGAQESAVEAEAAAQASLIEPEAEPAAEPPLAAEAEVEAASPAAEAEVAASEAPEPIGGWAAVIAQPGDEEAAAPAAAEAAPLALAAVEEEAPAPRQPEAAAEAAASEETPAPLLLAEAAPPEAPGDETAPAASPEPETAAPDSLRFGATLQPDGSVTLTGRPMDAETQQALLGWAASNFGADAIDDQMQVVAPPPDESDWTPVAFAAMDALKALLHGEVTLKEDIIRISGLALSDEDRASVATTLRPHARGGYRLREQISVRTPEQQAAASRAAATLTPGECGRLLAAAMARQPMDFARGSANLTGASLERLEYLAPIIKTCDNAKIEIGGHTDSAGPSDVNQRLSERRARSVRDALVSFGVATEALVVRGYGEENPIADNGTAAGRAQNRRIEFKVNAAGD